MSNSKIEERRNSLLKELEELNERYDATKSWARKGYIMAQIIDVCDALREMEATQQGA